MNHNEVYTDSWKKRKHEWVDFVKNDVLYTVFSYARYSKAMEEVGGLE